MDSSAARKSTATLRYERYKAVVDCLVGRASFHLSQIQHGCPEEKPAFVTRVVNELVDNGWILREDKADQKHGSAAYRWNDSRGAFPATRWLDERMFGTQIKESPEHSRPRERLLAAGPQNLKTSELAAILIRSGRPGESAVTAGEKLAREFGDRLKDLPEAGRAELKLISSAIEKTAYCQIMAGIELGRRVAAVIDEAAVVQIRSASDARAYCQRKFVRLAQDAKQEEFHIVTLDTKNQVINTHQITVGTLDASLVHPREVFRRAIRDAAASVILVHNHPSGNCTPSPEDHAVTKRLEAAGDLLGIEVLDHIVLGRNSAASIREQ